MLDGAAMKVSALAEKVDDLRTEMDGKFAVVDKNFEELRREITAEGETTRRQFEVVAEKMLSERNLSIEQVDGDRSELAGLTATNAGDHVRTERQLDDHDRRLEAIQHGRATGAV
jgi:hypothetical protein